LRVHFVLDGQHQQHDGVRHALRVVLVGVREQQLTR
jgi:hypothetical protein